MSVKPDKKLIKQNIKYAEQQDRWIKSALDAQREELGVNIIAIKSLGDINVSPSADYAIQSEDVMVVLGDSIALKEVQKL